MQKRPDVTFAHQLISYTEARGLSDGRLAKLTNLPRYTIRNWLRGVTKSPRHWQDILRLAHALRLDAQEVEALLVPTKHPSLHTLWQEASPQDKGLFERWRHVLQTAVTAPFLAPPQIPYFVGREAIRQTVTQHLLNQQTIVTIQGMGGVGKTSLATQLAYELQAAFPDGILWARVDVSDPLTSLMLFAAAYEEDATPFKTLASRSQFVRNVLSPKKALIILDNAEKSEQIAPFLPATNGQCRVLITTRQQNLSLLRGWPRVNLPPFTSPNESLALFQQLLGKPMSVANQTTLGHIAELLGHLPLAIAIIGGRLAYEPAWSAERIYHDLQQRHKQLGLVADEGQSVRLSFDLSYAALSEPLRHFFAALGTFAVTGFSLEAVSAVTQCTAEETARALHELVALSLVQEGANGRYLLHPLMHTYAQEKLNSQAPLLNAVTYFVQYSQTYQTTFEQLEKEADNIFNALDTAYMHHWSNLFIEGVLAFNDYLVIRGFDNLALPYIQKGQQLAQQNEQIEALAWLTCYEGTILERSGQFAQAEAQYQAALQLAYHSEEIKLITTLLQHIGRVMKEQKQFDRAREFLVQSLQFAQENEQPEIVCNLYNSLGSLTISHYGDYSQAQRIFEQGLHLAHQLSYQRMVYFFALNLAGIAYRLGQYEKATDWMNECLATAQQLNYTIGLSIAYRGQSQLIIAQTGDYLAAETLLKKALANLSGANQLLRGYLLIDLSDVLHQQNNQSEALSYLNEGLQLMQATDDPGLQRLAYWVQGALTKDSQMALACFQDALILAETDEDDWNLCEVLLPYGMFMQKQGKEATAVTLFTRLQTISHQQGFPAFEGAALFHLAQLAYQAGDIEKAKSLGQESLAVWQRINHYRAGDVHTWLSNGATTGANAKP